MNEEALKYYDPNLNLQGQPQVYKEISIYPLKLSESKYIDLLYKIFGYPKKYIKDPNVMKLSYLKYLLYCIYPILPGEQDLGKDLVDFLSFVTKGKEIKFLEERIELPEFIPHEEIDTIQYKLLIDGKKFTERDFDNIREIILEQNYYDIEIIEAYDPELESYLEVVSGDSKYVDFEDEVFHFCDLSGILVNNKDLWNYTLYQFKKHLGKLIQGLYFKIYSPLEVSGQIKSQYGGKIYGEFINHAEKRGRYDSIFIDKDKFVANNKMFDKN